MIRRLISEDLADLIFRILFSSIFLGLGIEHLFHDELIQTLIPDWMEYKRAASITSGVVLITGGTLILVGAFIQYAAAMLGVFLITVTAVIHAPALFMAPPGLPADWRWLWDLYQRSNFVKNLCLLGVCFYLVHHQPGSFSIDAWLRARRNSSRP